MRRTIFRITLWAGVGLLIALAWAYYFANADKAAPIAPLVGALAHWTQPAVSTVLFFDPAARIGLYGSALANAAAYALIGLLVETIRRSNRAQTSWG